MTTPACPKTNQPHRWYQTIRPEHHGEYGCYHLTYPILCRDCPTEYDEQIHCSRLRTLRRAA